MTKAPRTTRIPDDLAAALSVAERRAYDSLSDSHRKEYLLWIEDAKRPETRARRIERVRQMLREKGRSA